MIDQFYYTAKTSIAGRARDFTDTRWKTPAPALRCRAYLRRPPTSADGGSTTGAAGRNQRAGAHGGRGPRFDLGRTVDAETFDSLGSADKPSSSSASNGHIADYGHCDLAWSRYAPKEIFPVMIEWLDRRQPGVGPSPQSPARSIPPSPSSQEGFDANL